jgi:hypothetical protein
MQNAHTPGPWKAAQSDPAEGAHVFWIVAPQGCGPNNGEVDIVSVPGNKPANANLIAAAPDLLLALRRLLAVMGEGNSRGRALDLVPKQYTEAAEKAVAMALGNPCPGDAPTWTSPCLTATPTS